MVLVASNYFTTMGCGDAFAAAGHRTNQQRRNVHWQKALFDFLVFGVLVVTAAILWRGAHPLEKKTMDKIYEEIILFLIDRDGSYLKRTNKRSRDKEEEGMNRPYRRWETPERDPTDTKIDLFLFRNELRYPLPEKNYQPDFVQGGPVAQPQTWRKRAENCLCYLPAVFKEQEGRMFCVFVHPDGRQCYKKHKARCVSCGTPGCIMAQGALDKTYLYKLHTSLMAIDKSALN